MVLKLMVFESENSILPFFRNEFISNEFMNANVSFNLEFRKESLILLIHVLHDFAEVVQKRCFS